MKKQLVLALLAVIILFFSGYSQKIIDNPVVGLNVTPNLKLTKVEIGDTATVLSFHATNPSNKEMIILKETYIQPVNGKDKLVVSSAKGVTIGEKFNTPASGEMDYQLIFPKISPATDRIDFGVKKELLFDIWLKSFAGRTVNKELKGNWYNRETGDWELSFLDTTAVYKSKLWQLDTEKLKNGEGIVSLKHKENNINLYLKKGKKGTYLIGESPKSLKEYCSTIKGLEFKSNDTPYQLPVFKRDSAVFSGCINGFRLPRDENTIHTYFSDILKEEQRTIKIYVSDILKGEQKTFFIKIAEDGTFAIKIPLCYPHRIIVGSDLFEGTVFLEPGKELFTMVDLNQQPIKLFMGEIGRVNSDLLRMEKISTFDYFDMLKKMLGLNQTEYKNLLLEFKGKDMNALEAFSKQHSLSAKALQVKKLEVEYSYSVHLMNYKNYLDHASRIENKYSQKPEEVKIEYYDFISDEVVNNPLAVISDNYNSFLRALKYSEILKKTAALTPLDIMVALEASGHALTNEEKKLFEAIKKNGITPITASEAEFQERYLGKGLAFIQKYKDQLIGLKIGKNEEPSMVNIERFLKDKAIQFTEAEVEFISAAKELEKDENVIIMREFRKQQNALIQKFYKDHPKFIDNYSITMLRIARDENLEKLFHIKKGIASDIMTSQDFTGTIVDEKKQIDQQISTSFIAEYLYFCNETAIAKVEANKSNAGILDRKVRENETNKGF